MSLTPPAVPDAAPDTVPPATAAHDAIAARIGAEIGARPAQVLAAVELLDGGATVPFIARYRKEATGALDDTQLRTLETRLAALRALEERRATVLAGIAAQGALGPGLRAQVLAAQTLQTLEDLYLPYKPKRRSKAQSAREAGLEPLALALLADPQLDPQAAAAAYVRPQAPAPEQQVADVKAALEGARHILMERFAEDAALLEKARRLVQAEALLVSTVVAGKEAAAAKFRDWFDFREALSRMPSHRALALLRGRNEDLLRLAVKLPAELADPPQPSPGIALVAEHAGLADRGRPADRWLLETARWAWTVKIGLHLELEALAQLRERAEAEAIRVFAGNLRDLLLAAPAGPRVTIGLDPGLRTGVKVAVVDGTGKLLETATIYPHEPRRDWDGSLERLRQLAQRHGASLLAIGNGTASRETDRLAAELLRRHPELGLSRVLVSEAGASVYSASELAAREFPDVDVSLRGAVSIARRLQDPLAELVKIDPKSIGVGQYQHDVNPGQLARTLDTVVEDCVNAVGVDLNTASVPLLARVSGLSRSLAENIVAFRDRHGAFGSRAQLREVPRLGEKTFEQAAGFLRIRAPEGAAPGAHDPLDASAVHPESYGLVERILADLGRPLHEVLGNRALLRSVPAARYADVAGLPTVRDVLLELEKPGRDPRPDFVAVRFREGIEALEDLQAGMLLDGVVTNVTNFGAFVDIGVHQDGLVHISALSEGYVTDPRSVVKAGDRVRVKVLEVDRERRRIALTMRLADPAAPRRGPAGRGRRRAEAAGGNGAHRVGAGSRLRPHAARGAAGALNERPPADSGGFSGSCSAPKSRRWCAGRRLRSSSACA